MYKANDVVLYGVDGVCRVEGKTVRTVAGKPIEYYVLRSCQQQSTIIYVPTDNEQLVGRMRKALSGEETLELIRRMPEEATIWIDDDNERASAYEKILSGEDRMAVVRMIKTLYERKQALAAGKRKMHASDEKLLHEGERRLYDEFAHALGIDVDDVLPFIFSQAEPDAGVNPEGMIG